MRVEGIVHQVFRLYDVNLPDLRLTIHLWTDSIDLHKTAFRISVPFLKQIISDVVKVTKHLNAIALRIGLTLVIDLKSSLPYIYLQCEG